MEVIPLSALPQGCSDEGLLFLEGDTVVFRWLQVWRARQLFHFLEDQSGLVATEGLHVCAAKKGTACCTCTEDNISVACASYAAAAAAAVVVVVVVMINYDYFCGRIVLGSLLAPPPPPPQPLYTKGC